MAKLLQKFLPSISKLNVVFLGELFLFALIVTGILPREAALFLGAGLVLYVLTSPLEDSTILFIRSIPLFLALPFTSGFDNFNTWRIISIVIFLKWFFKHGWIPKFNIKNFSGPLYLLLVLAFLSLIPAADKILALKRIIYFMNLSLIGFVVFDLGRNSDLAKRMVKNIAIPVVIVSAAGFVQLLSTYFIDIYQFMRLWGEGIQCRQFGNTWCSIAVELGNTWFAYYGEQLSLRVFSLFPDSHSFPQFVLLGVPAIFAITNKRWIKTTSVSLLFLITILSGTRGIWAASIGVLLLAIGLIIWLKRFRVANRIIFKNITVYLISFFAMFAIAFPIFTSPQFLLSKDNSEILKARIRSIIDFGETSNAQRIEIWKKTLSSISEKPLLGVGIGNYPVVLGQDLFLAEAGSSAHNIYLHIAAEMGILSLVLALWFLWLLFKESYQKFTKEKDAFLATYFAASILFVPWVLIYSLTDVAIFDERAFLLFVTTSALILIKK